jgi:hypothetical protein
MQLLDSNIVIYAATPTGAVVQQLVRGEATAVSKITRLECWDTTS